MKVKLDRMHPRKEARKKEVKRGREVGHQRTNGKTKGKGEKRERGERTTSRKYGRKGIGKPRIRYAS